ncbi:Suf-domain-containing protein [Pluteus cervinus]|uniref:Suf-domain-containing protein n=1 Tax=Pluteus cervinus TaxID=181527 RepID=A0ACD3AF70_9AGAR|nr:Suf-domain-containing protein [Pluteus cervinus]
MTEPTPADTSADFATDFPGDQTQPSLEILRALSSLSPVKTEHVPPQTELPPPTEYEALTAQLKEKPHNPEGWKRLVELAESSGDLQKVRETYDALLKQYPNTPSAQIAYIGHFVNEPEHFGEAEELFRRFLRTSPFVDLWKYYLTYVRRLNTKPANRDVIVKSYNFALNHVGQDRESGEIWNDYLQFLKMGEASSTWEEQQKMDALRKVYHSAVQIPLDNVEKLWQELEAFETGLNRITAKKFMADLSPAHMQARATLRQVVKHTADLYLPSTSSGGRPDLYLPGPPTFDASDRALVGRWKAYLKLEESNPLELEEKDKNTLITRIQGVYRKAVIRMRYFSEIWCVYMAFTWTHGVGKADESMAILKAGLEANPTSFILTLAYAEVQELKKDYADVHNIYDAFLSRLKVEFDAYDRPNGTTPTLHQNGFPNDEKPSKGSEFEERRKEYGLAYIMYMRFGRRAEGVKASRTIFGRARKDRWTPWEVYEAAALMEYHSSDDKSVASRIFEKGLETFGEELDYVLRYLGFLISINDASNARALFERVINTFSSEQARPLWERWARYEYQYGDLEAAQKLEKRIAEVYPSGMYPSPLALSILKCLTLDNQTHQLNDLLNVTRT